MNKRTAALIGVAVVLLLFAGVFCGAAAAAYFDVSVDKTDVSVGDSVTLKITNNRADTPISVWFSYASGNHCFDPLPGDVDIFPGNTWSTTLIAKTAGKCSIKVHDDILGEEISTPQITVDNKITIDFYNGTTIIETQTVKRGDTMNLPAAPTGTGTFIGWRVGSTTGNFFSLYQNSKYVFLIDSPYYDSSKRWTYNKSTLRLYAAWDGAGPTPASHTVSAAAGTGGSIPDAPTSPVTAGTTVTLTAAADPGYHFKEWQSIIGLPFSTSKDNPLKFYMPNKNVSVTAVFEADPTPAPSQTVIFLDANGGESNTTTVTATKGTTTAFTITNPAKSGYTFNGFYTEKTNGTKVIDSAGALQAATAYTDTKGKWTSDEKTLVLYAQWTPVTPGTATVTFNVQGHGTAPDP